MGLTTTAPLVLPTRRTVVFTTSQTWTVPSSCLYADVMVVGAGGGGGGGGATSGNPGTAGAAGGITILREIYLGGTGTVSIVVGAGGTAGAAGATIGTTGGNGGYSGFGTYVYSQGGSGNSGLPGYKGTLLNPYNGGDTTLANFAPMLSQSNGQSGGYSSSYLIYNTPTTNPLGGSTTLNAAYTVDGLGFGIQGGSQSSYPGMSSSPVNNNSAAFFGPTPTLPWGATAPYTTPSAGTAGNQGTAGAAGSLGYGGGGGNGGYSSSAYGKAGGPGAGGGGGASSSGTSGAGGAGATNSGGGGGGGGSNNVGSVTAGAGGAGGSGFVIVSYVGTN